MTMMSRRRTSSSSSSSRRREGFRLGRKLARVFRWAPFFFLFRRKRWTNPTTRYQQLQMDDVDSNIPQIEETNTQCNSNNNRKSSNRLAKLCRWGKSLAKVKELVCSNNTNTTTTATTDNSTSNTVIKSSHRHRYQGRPAGTYIRLGVGDCSSPKKNENRTGGLRVPKGHLALYVGGKEEEETLQRVVIPVIYLNHPSFEKLLKEAEDVYGFDQPGRISLPCPFSEFDSVLRSTKDINNTSSAMSRWRRRTRFSSSSSAAALDYRSKPQP